MIVLEQMTFQRRLCITNIRFQTDAAKDLAARLLGEVERLSGDDLVNHVADIQYDLECFLSSNLGSQGFTIALFNQFTSLIIRGFIPATPALIGDLQALERGFMALLETFPEPD